MPMTGCLVIAYQPINIGALPAIMPKKVHDIVLRHTAEATTPTMPMKKHIGDKIQASARPIKMSDQGQGQRFFRRLNFL